MRKLLILFGYIIALYSFGQYNHPEDAWTYKDRDIDDKEFLSDSKIWKAYAKANLEYFDKLTNPKHNFCGDTEKPNVLRALLNEGYGNIKFFKLKNTDIFYSSEDEFQCDMSLSVFKHEFPLSSRQKLVAQGKEEADAFYWTTSIIAKRWYIAAQSLKKCGIRIKDFSLTTFETKKFDPQSGLDPFSVPKLYAPSPRSNNIVSSLIQDDELFKRRSVKAFYTGELPSNDPDFEYATAAGDLAKEDDPTMRSMWFKRLSIASPIFSPKSDNPTDKGYVDELHELYHLLTGKHNEECHFDPKKFPKRFGPMSDTIMNQGGLFIPKECEEMRRLGEKSKLLTCYPKRPFRPNPELN